MVLDIARRACCRSAISDTYRELVDARAAARSDAQQPHDVNDWVGRPGTRCTRVGSAIGPHTPVANGWDHGRSDRIGLYRRAPLCKFATSYRLFDRDNLQSLAVVSIPPHRECVYYRDR